jgi:chromate transporter
MAGPQGDPARGALGALVCAAAIFLPSFLFVIGTGPLVARLRNSPLTSGFIDGVNAAVVGSIIATTWSLLLASAVNLNNPSRFTLGVAGASVDLPALLIGVLSAALLLRLRRLNSTYLIAAGALAGLLVQTLL